MKFKIVSIKGNSVRVDTGIISFDVKVICDSDGNLQLTLPAGIFVPETENFKSLAGATKAAYQKSLLGEINNVNTERKIISVI